MLKTALRSWLVFNGVAIDMIAVIAFFFGYGKAISDLFPTNQSAFGYRMTGYGFLIHGCVRAYAGITVAPAAINLAICSYVIEIGMFVTEVTLHSTSTVKSSAPALVVCSLCALLMGMGVLNDGEKPKNN